MTATKTLKQTRTERAQEELNDWKPVARTFLNGVKKLGYQVYRVETEEISEETKFTEIVADLTACDEANVFIKGPRDRSLWFFLVWGNSPEESIADHSADGDAQMIADYLEKQWEGRKTPRTTYAKAYPEVYGEKALAQMAD